MSDDATRPSGQPAPDDGTPSPGIDEAIRQVGAAGKATLGSGKDTLRALRRLISADLALARSAFGRSLAWAGVAIVFGASSWLLLAGAIIALLQRLGLSWFQSLFFTALASLAMTALAVWRVSRFFDHMGMHATRRQLTRLGVFDEHHDDDEEPEPARAAPAAQHASMAARDREETPR
ncbi:MAG TPA: phage holin family protein [Stenotrophomonas sp.]